MYSLELSKNKEIETEPVNVSSSLQKKESPRMTANKLKLKWIRLSRQQTRLLSHLVWLTVDISEQLNISMGSPRGEMDGDGAREGVRKQEMFEKKGNQSSWMR